MALLKQINDLKKISKKNDTDNFNYKWETVPAILQKEEDREKVLIFNFVVSFWEKKEKHMFSLT